MYISSIFLNKQRNKNTKNLQGRKDGSAFERTGFICIWPRLIPQHQCGGLQLLFITSVPQNQVSLSSRTFCQAQSALTHIQSVVVQVKSDHLGSYIWMFTQEEMEHFDMIRRTRCMALLKELCPCGWALRFKSQ